MYKKYKIYVFKIYMYDLLHVHGRSLLYLIYLISIIHVVTGSTCMYVYTRYRTSPPSSMHINVTNVLLV